MKKSIVFLTAIAVATIGSAIHAETFGYGGVSIGIGTANNPEDGDKNEFGQGSLGGAVATSVGEKGTVVLEGALYEDDKHVDGSTGATVFRETKTQFQVGVHYLHDIGGNKLGGFIAYAETPHANSQFGDGNDDYRTLFGGVEGIYAATPETTVYGQFAYGNAHNDGADSIGFEKGYVVRVGGAYSGIKNTLLKVEAEAYKSSGYEDSGENGFVRKYSLLGETGINADNSLVFTYGASYGKFVPKSDGDTIEEERLDVGLRYYFGGTTSAEALNAGLIGLPTSIIQSMKWVPDLD